jgi:ubiquinone/menaquinone biosynthesis C-methylase UbiE
MREAAKRAVGGGYKGVAHAWLKWQPQHASAGRLETQAIVIAGGARPGMNVLDVAGGAGEPSLALAEAVAPGGRVTVTDLVPEMLTVAETLARQRGLTNISFQQADAEALPFPDASFDLVTSRSAIMHFPDAARALGEARRVLKPGGRAVFTALGPFALTPSGTTSVGVLMRYAHPQEANGPAPHPYRFAEPGALAAEFKTGGFRAIEEHSLVLPWPWPGTPRDYWESLLERTWGVEELLAAVPPDLREQAIAEVLAEIGRYEAGGQLNFTLPIVLVTGLR